jgi:tyrosinase
MATFTRANAWNNGGTFSNTDLLWYAKGVGVMQQRALNDVSSWWFFAAIHGEYITETQFPGWGFLPSPPPVPTSPQPTQSVSDLYWDQCQHQSWYFPPWHRGYLLALEAQVRAAVVSLGGPSTWALPYWDYFGPGQEFNIPSAFTQQTLPDGSPNALFVKARYGPDGDSKIWVPTAAGMKQHPNDPNVQTEVTEDCLSNDVYTGTDANTVPPGFGGPATDFSHAGGSSGNLENNPHNFVHVYVGGFISNSDYGLMSDPGLAALDPIFYLHHANIDRMWAVWNESHSNPTDPRCLVDTQWLNGPASLGEREFVMPMPTGEWVYTPKQMSSLSQVNYTYDSLPKHRVPKPLPLTERLKRLGATAAAARVEQGATVTPGTNVELVGASQQPIPVKGSGASSTVKLDAGVRDKLSASLSSASETAAPDRVFLNLENVRGTHDAAVLSVYLNLPEGAKPSDHPELLAGGVGLFGLRRASAIDGRHGGQGLNFVLDITKVADTLHLNNALNADSLRVTIVPNRAVPDQSEITVGRISIYRQGR